MNLERQRSKDSDGDAWLLEVVPVARRVRGGVELLTLVFPPHRFTGRARVSIISGGRRTEALARWREGRREVVAAASGAGVLEKLLGAAVHPVAAGIAVASSKRLPRRLQVSVLIEEIDSGRSLTLDWTAGTSGLHPRILLVPVLADPVAEGVLGKMLKGARRDEHMRFGIAEWILPEKGGRKQGRIRREIAELALRGRVDLLATGDSQERPWYVQTRLRGAGSSPQGDTSSDRWEIFLPWERPPLLGRLTAENGCGLRYELGEAFGLDPSLEGEALGVAAFVRAALAAREGSGIRRLGAELHVPWFVHVSHIKRPERLGRMVRKWNKRHLFPLIELLTPSDYFALIEEVWRMAGTPPLPRRGASG